MTDILCKWLNEELRLSQVVDPKTFSQAFSSGYLFGEILHKYQLQNDFHMFMKKERSISMLNNFTRLEPTFHLLEIPFSANTAQELMQEKQGAAAHIVHQLYISLERKKKADISGVVMEVLQPAAVASLHKKEREIYRDRLHKVVKREAQVNLQRMSKYYENKVQQISRAEVATAVQQKKAVQKQEEKSKRNSDKVQMSYLKPKKPMTFNQISIVQAPKPPPQLNLKKQRQEKLAQYVQNEIAQFETKKRKLPSSSLSNMDRYDTEVQSIVSKPVLLSNSVYIQQIRQRLEEDTLAREQRDKKVDRFLVEQAKAREAEQNAKHEEYLIKRSTRPTKQGQRLEAQLQQIRTQKEVFINNRLFREQQIQKRREQDLQEAMRREAVLAEQERMARAEEIKRKLDLCNRLAADRDQIIYQKHAESCKEIVEQIVDLATKVGEYRLSGNPVPVKQMKEWKEVLFSGVPLYETTNVGNSEHPTDTDPVELQKQDILNNMDYDEYINMTGEWMWPEGEETKLPPTNNNILGSVVARLRKLVQPPREKPAKSPFPHFSLKACVLGKLCSGKTSCLAKIAQAHGIHILSAPVLVNEALSAYNNSETVTESDHEKETATYDNKDLPNDVAITKLSTQVMYGREAEMAMMEGKILPLELLTKIITEAIQQIPANSGWILDGLPGDITQAHLLEKALVGSVEVEECVVTNSRVNLAVDPDPPKAPPPPAPALDLALLLDVSDECAVSRAVNLAYAEATDSTPDYLCISQIPHRVTAFQETWPELEEWFGTKQNILMRVDASVDEEELFNSVDSVIQLVKRPVPEAVATPLNNEASDGGTAPQDSSTPFFDPSSNQELAVNPNLTESSSSLSAQKEGRKMLQMSTNNLKGPSRRSSMSTEGSLKNVAKPLPPGISEALHQHWENACEMYLNNVKGVMQELRLETTMINLHFLDIKEEFEHYLDRLDLRQEFVSQWQKDFNNVADDMRDDEETKAELHLRLDELCERLWNISEKRKEENEQERAAVMGDGWLSDHTALLVNYHSILIQVELDRFRDTFFILKKYNLSTNNKSVPETQLNLRTLSLLDASSLQDLEAQSQTQSEHEQHQKKLVDDHEAAVTAIDSLLPTTAQQREAELSQTKEKAQEIPPSANKGKKKPPSAKKKKGREIIGAPSPLPAVSPEETEFKAMDQTMTDYVAALNHEEEAAKVRITLVKGHGLNLVHSIQSNAEQIFICMEEWLEEHFNKGMKSIEQLSEVVRHHIESGAKLQQQLVLDHTHFCLNGDFQMVSLPPLPSRPPPLETPSEGALSIIQLESLCQQFRLVAPNGLLPCMEFSTLLKKILIGNMKRNSWTEPLINMSEAQLMEIVALLKDRYEFVNWRRFVLSCAQPWPFPSVTQLLDALQHLKATDVENKGYINEEQYLQTQLWFPEETVQEIPQDPSEPLPYNRLSNLHKFLFQVFADHSSIPPRLDYTSMLQYLAADPNPKQGFVRALSVVVGRHLRQSSSTQLVTSMPSLVEVPEFSSPDLDALNYNCSESPSSGALLGNQKVSIPALLTVIGHGCSGRAQDSQTQHTELVGVYKELGYEPEDSVPFSTLSTHPFMQFLMESSTQHQLVNVYP